jgi:hypothetical protein
MSKKLWEQTQERINQTNMMKFMKRVNEKYKLNITGYDDDTPKIRENLVGIGIRNTHVKFPI